VSEVKVLEDANKYDLRSIANIVYSNVQAWVSDLSAESGAKLVRSCHSVLFGILEDAVRDRRLPSNPAAGVKLPRLVKQPRTYLTASQLVQLAQESGRYTGLVLLLGNVGLRWNEAATLRVADFDFLRRTVSVIEDPAAGKTVKSSKHRTLYIPEFVVTELSRTAAGKGHTDLMWPSEKGVPLKSPSSHDTWFSGAVSRCQRAAERARAAEVKAVPGSQPVTPVFPRITPHDLRDTAASLAISSGANVKAVQRMLGHASAAMTLDVYAELFDDDLAAVADRLQDNVGKMWATARNSSARKAQNPQ
jgi:integrase